MRDDGKVVLTGEVSDIPVIRATRKGEFSATFSLRCKPERKSAPTKRHLIVAYGETAYQIRSRVRKGHHLTVEGKYELKQWEEKSSGQTRHYSRLVIDRLTFIEPDQLRLVA